MAEPITDYVLNPNATDGNAGSLKYILTRPGRKRLIVPEGWRRSNGSRVLPSQFNGVVQVNDRVDMVYPGSPVADAIATVGTEWQFLSGASYSRLGGWTAQGGDTFDDARSFTIYGARYLTLSGCKTINDGDDCSIASKESYGIQFIGHYFTSLPPASGKVRKAFLVSPADGDPPRHQTLASYDHCVFDGLQIRNPQLSGGIHRFTRCVFFAAQESCVLSWDFRGNFIDCDFYYTDLTVGGTFSWQRKGSIQIQRTEYGAASNQHCPDRSVYISNCRQNGRPATPAQLCRAYVATSGGENENRGVDPIVLRKTPW